MSIVSKRFTAFTETYNMVRQKEALPQAEITCSSILGFRNSFARPQPTTMESQLSDGGGET